MNIIRLRPRYDRDSAVRKFCAKSLKVPSGAELVYLPFVLFKYTLETTPFLGENKKSEGLFLVDLVQGVPVNIKKGTSFEVAGAVQKDFSALIPEAAQKVAEEDEVLVIEPHQVSEDQALPAVLDKEEAISRGKRLLRYDLMRLAGGLRYKKFGIRVQPEMRTVHYPFWVIYYRNRRGEMKINALDALSGRRESREIVTSIQMSLVKKAKASPEIELTKGAHQS